VTGKTYRGVPVPSWAVSLNAGAWHKGVKDAQAAAGRSAAGPDTYRGVTVPSWVKGAAATAWREGVRDAQNAA
jgi:hypothetical protein